MMQTDVFKESSSAEPTESECCVCSLGGAARFLPMRQPGHTTVQHNRISSFIMWFQLQELQDFRGKSEPQDSMRINTVPNQIHLLPLELSASGLDKAGPGQLLQGRR